MGTARWGALGFGGALLVAASALAQDDYSDKGFGLRLPSAFLRFTQVSAMGGGSAANRWSSAVNPAAADWTPIPGHFGFVLAPYASYISFANGTDLMLTAESLTWNMGELGTIQPVIVQIRSNRATTRQGLLFDYTVDYGQLGWAKRFGDWAIGATANYAKARTVFDMGDLRVSKSRGENYRLRVGALYQPAERWLTGCALEYAYSPFTARAIAFTPFGPMPVRIHSAERHVIVRPGVSYEYADYSTIHLDYQYGRFQQRGFENLHSHYWVAGIDHRMFDWLFMRSSASIDGRGNLSGMCGLGAHLSRNVSLDLGYHYDMLPELQPELGRSQVWQFVLAARF